MQTQDQGVPDGTVGAIVLAAGSSRRMGAADKVFLSLLERPLVSYSLKTLNDSPKVDSIVLVTSPDKMERAQELVSESGWEKVSEVCLGGVRRQDSVRSGLERIGEMAWVIVHDAARPFVDEGIITRGLREVRHTGAAVSAVPVRDTIKSANSDGVVTETLDRSRLWHVQTPQLFAADTLRGAHNRISHDVTDDASMVERIGGTVRVFAGSYENFKITTPQDVAIAEAVLRARQARE